MHRRNVICFSAHKNGKNVFACARVRVRLRVACAWVGVRVRVRFAYHQEAQRLIKPAPPRHSVRAARWRQPHASLDGLGSDRAQDLSRALSEQKAEARTNM